MYLQLSLSVSHAVHACVPCTLFASFHVLDACFVRMFHACFRHVLYVFCLCFMHVSGMCCMGFTLFCTWCCIYALCTFCLETSGDYQVNKQVTEDSPSRKRPMRPPSVSYVCMPWYVHRLNKIRVHSQKSCSSGKWICLMMCTEFEWVPVFLCNSALKQQNTCLLAVCA